MIEKVSEKYKDVEGQILYKFPSIKELDKRVIVPDVLIASETMGIIVIVVDTMQVLREAEMEIFKEKIEIIDDYIYTSLMKNRNLKQNARSLKISVTTLGYCPNLSINLEDENIFCSVSSILEYIDKMDELCAQEVVEEAIASLEQATAMIKPKERIWGDEDKTQRRNCLKI